MAASNAGVAELLRKYAGVLSAEGADRFKIKAYRRAAETVETLSEDVAVLLRRGDDLKRLPGIGKAISETIAKIVLTGHMPQLEKAGARVGPEVLELAGRPLLDAKTVLRIYKKLGIKTLEELRTHLETGRIREAFGARTEFHVRRGLADRPRLLLYKAEPLAASIEQFLGSLPGVTRVSRAGSLRRKTDTVGDLNFLFSASADATVFDRFKDFGGVRSMEKRSNDDAIYQVSSGLSVSLRWTSDEEWGLSLIQATGSAAHLQQLQRANSKRRIALTRQSLVKRRIQFSREQDVYRGLGLEFIEPELREGLGEVQAAQRGELPQLVRVEDLQGDLHMHTTASDGANSIYEMAQAARRRGYRYIAITDHSQSLKLTNGLTERRLRQQIRQIDKLNARWTDFVILKSAEVDILEDGRLDYSEGMLKELDLTICSIHSRFGLDKEKQTERILRAMDNRYFNILGHATGRLLLKREGYDLDMDRILDHAKERGCYFEINSSPDRLDLSDEHAKLAKDRGIKIAVNTDAHSVGELEFIHAGINQARRAWLESDDVLNAMSLPALKRALRR